MSEDKTEQVLNGFSAVDVVGTLTQLLASTKWISVKHGAGGALDDHFHVCGSRMPSTVKLLDRSLYCTGIMQRLDLQGFIGCTVVSFDYRSHLWYPARAS